MTWTLSEKSPQTAPFRLVFLLFLLTACLTACLTAQETPLKNASWKEVDRLIGEQRFEAAAEQVDSLLEAAREAGDESAWTRGLIRRAQLRLGLHGPETALRDLRGTPWPSGARSRLVLELFYGHALSQYFHTYSWEILQRERTVSEEEVDLRAWTSEQIVAAANRAFSRAWEEREAWGVASLDELSQFIEPNDDPPHIRGTLRDIVTRLWIDLLDNSAWWRPEDDELFRLDAAALIHGASDSDAQAVDLVSAKTHPLIKIGALLDDLEAWHRREGRPEAAFEARLERLRRLSNHFQDEEIRDAVRREIERASEELGREFPWWSMGRFDLAQKVRESELSKNRVEARRIALEGMEAHPGSRGAALCQQLVAGIEKPSFGVRAMRSDGARRRSLMVESSNLKKLYFRAWASDLREMVRDAKGARLLPDARAVGDLRGRTPDVTWEVDLNEPGDYETHRTFVTPPLESPGLWVISASARKDFREIGNQMVALNFLLGDLVIFSRPTDREEHGTELTVRNGVDGRAVEGAEVTLYRYDWRKKHQVVATARTDAEGRVAFPTDLRQRYFALASHSVSANHSEQVQLTENIAARYGHDTEPSTDALLFTDRSVYRPGQTLHWKVVAYEHDPESSEKRFRTLGETEIFVELFDTNGEVVDSATVHSNDFGSASGTFVLASGRALGNWSLRTTVGGHAMVRVEEYKRPSFEVTLDDPAGELALNRPATLSGTARYYFGLPVTSGEARWRVTREPVFRWWWFRPPPGGATRTIAVGSSPIHDDGGFEIDFTPEADPRLGEDGVSYRYRISAEVTDEGGETRAAERSFRLGFVAVDARIRSEAGFFRAAEGGEIEISRIDLDGRPRAGGGAWRLMALQPPAVALPADLPRVLQEHEHLSEPVGDDLLRPRWETGYAPQQVIRSWEDGEEVARGELEHGDDGLARVEIPALEPGVYRLRYSTRDEAGALFEIDQAIFVGGGAEESETPASQAPLAALLKVESSRVEVGASARLLVGSGWAEQEMELEILRQGTTVRRERLVGGLRTLEIPVPEAWRGGFAVRLSILRDHQTVRLEERLDVPWPERRLEIKLATFRDLLRPGARESWRVSLGSVEGEDLAAGAVEMLASMYDRSLDLFGEHTPPDPLTLGMSWVDVPAIRDSLGQTGPVWRGGRNFGATYTAPARRADRLRFLDGWNIGGPGARGGRMMMKSMHMERGMVAFDALEESMVVTAEAPAAQAAEGGMAAAAVPAAPAPPAPPQESPSNDGGDIRRDFSETAFWHPHLLLDDDGGVSFEFTVPDAVTEWTFWARALTQNLQAGNLEQQVRSAKDLLARPYLPRFLREGDRAQIRVAVDNAGESELEGTVELEILDPETGVSRLAEFGVDAAEHSFHVEPGKGTTVVFPLDVPHGVGEITVRAMARAGDLSDGEQRPLPILPSRMHLIESRFAALSENDRRTLRFEIADDPTRIEEEIIVTLEGQLLSGVLGALPYLVDYPYDCTEQTLNRFLTTGIVARVFAEHPILAGLAKKRADARGDELYESWDAEDPNRAMQLEETPWLRTSRGDAASHGEKYDLIRILDPEIAFATRDTALQKLENAQTSSGGFPWWPGGPPSPGMTLYLLRGFARALEHGIEVPQPMVVRAWQYLHRDWEKLIDDEESHWRRLTELNWVLSSYPDVMWTGGVFTEDDRARMLDISLRHWREHSPYLKGQLALTAARAGRRQAALKVWESVMDSARTHEDLGTYWMPEERAWLWYNDTVETHAFALRVLGELLPEDPRRHGLVQWLFLDKKLGHWKSTRASAEAIYALVGYLSAEDTLAVREQARVRFGDEKRDFVFEPDEPGKKQWVIEKPKLADQAEIIIKKSTKGLLFASATRHYSTEALPEASDGDLFAVERRYFLRRRDEGEAVLTPLTEDTELGVGDQVEVQLSLRVLHEAEYVHLRDPRGAGFEPETTRSGHRWDLGVSYFEEVRDSGTNFFFEALPAGEYTMKYRLRAAVAGTFRIAPAQLQSMYAPEFAARSSGLRVTVAD